MVVKGVVCKKNVAHRRMTSKFDKPRFLILGGALEYQRVANHLSSFDTLLQQEMDHLKMAVAKIDAHHPNVLLVEKSVSRFAQEYLLAKDISLVLNIKRPLLERIARCTGAQIVPSIDHLTSQKLGYCDSFHVEKFLEEHITAGQGGKKLTRTLMFFEGCPRPLGCTILLKGANEDELKKVKHVVQYGVFAAYHLALETSFLADEGATLPELPLKSPITVALPDKPSSIDRSISTIPGFTIGKLKGPLSFGEPYQSSSSLSSDISSSANIVPLCKLEVAQPFLPKGPTSQILNVEPAASSVGFSASAASVLPSGYDFSVPHQNRISSNFVFEENNHLGLTERSEAKTSAAKISEMVGDDNFVSNGFTEALGQDVCHYHSDGSLLTANCPGNSEVPFLEQDCDNQHEVGSLKDEFPSSPSNHQSILVSLSKRCVWKGTVCERSLTISVKKLPEFVLPGEREGKIWMWHRCLRCPRINGFPPATKRVVMSDAAWGLSFGKFLELSFSNHAAASRVANCGHSLHRDCLRFYGFGRMVACFRYASIDVHSVYLPPSKLEFNYAKQEWIQKEADEVRSSADLLFAEVYNALHKISEKILPECVTKSPLSTQQIAEVEARLQEEKYEFEASLQQVLNKDIKVGKPAIDILEINRLRKQLVFLSYAWDQRLIYVSSLSNYNLQEGLSIFLPKLNEKSIRSSEKPVEINATSKAGKRFSSCDSFLLDARSKISHNQMENGGDINQADGVHKGRDTDQDPNYNLRRKETRPYHSSSTNTNNQADSLDPGGTVRRVLSEGRFPVMENLSDTLDAAWTGESHPSSTIPQENDCARPPNPVTADSSTVAEPVRADLGLGYSKDHHRESELGSSFGLALPTKGQSSMDNSISWVGMPFSKLYQSFNEIFSSHVQKLRTFSDYNPVYVLSFRELLRQGGARLLLPVAITDTVVPVYDDEPTSAIAYALVSPDYQIQISEEPERLNGIESSVSLPVLDAANLLSLKSLTETTSESLKSLGSTDESILSMSGSRGSSGLDPVLYAKSVHPRVSFTDEGSVGKVKYTVTCYYAKRFEALRRTCCPSELDFIRSLSRCKKWGAQGGKSNVFFAKTMDDRFIIKQVTKTELESFIKFAPEYFKYLSESISTGSPTCLAKILGIYQVTIKHLKGGKESRMDVLVMENLLFRRNITRLYDLKGSARSRYNPDSSGSNKVLLDQNLIEAMPTSPIFVGNKAKRLLERAVWNDTAFLASADVMDYSLLVGVDEEKHELVLGIIDFMRQYTWDKHLETWVKASGILGGPKNTSPTVISPKQYKKRFRKAMSAYFVMVPDQWSPPTIIPSRSQSDLFSQDDRRVDR
ncbi:hypothetical protein LguiA_036310 [Lonicera macranthoides]